MLCFKLLQLFPNKPRSLTGRSPDHTVTKRYSKTARKEIFSTRAITRDVKRNRKTSFPITTPPSYKRTPRKLPFQKLMPQVDRSILEIKSQPLIDEGDEHGRTRDHIHAYIETGKREGESEKAQARGIEHYGVKYMWANFEGTSCGRWMKGTPPAAVIYHAVPCRAVHTYTTMMIHGGGKAGRRLSLVLIDVIDIGIRRRADYSAVNNSTPPPVVLLQPTNPAARPLLSFLSGHRGARRHFTTTTTA